MTFKLRALAWGCIAAGVSVAAQATPVVVDFNALGLEAGSSGIQLGSQYSAQGVAFSGDAQAFHNGSTSGNLNRVPCRPVRDCNSAGAQANGFVSNLGTGGFTITVTADRSFTGLLLDYAVGPLGFQFTVFSRPDANNVVQSVVHSIEGTGGGWSDWSLPINALSSDTTSKGVASLTATGFGDIDRIVFSTSGAFFAIDNLVFTASDSGGAIGGTAPEPASFALVALALGASGLVARRRRQT